MQVGSHFRQNEDLETFSDFPSGSDSKESVCNQETQVQSLGWEDPLEKGMATPLLYSCLENPMDRGAWWATVHGVPKSLTGLSE